MRMRRISESDIRRITNRILNEEDSETKRKTLIIFFHFNWIVISSMSCLTTNKR